MQKRIFNVSCRYEPSRMADQCLSDAYEHILKRLTDKFLNRNEESNDNSDTKSHK